MRNFFDSLINRKLRFYSTIPPVFLVMGEQGSGKSTFFSFLNRYYLSLGFVTLSNYPMQDAFQIPLKERRNKDGSIDRIIDKQWLYNSNLRDCVVFIDEAADIYPAREYATSWTASDTRFFTKLRKNHVILVLATQYYDLIDLNVKRACQQTWFLTQNRWFKNVTNIAVSKLVTAPVGSTQDLIMSKDLRGAYQCKYQLCEVPIADIKLYRKPYYKYFITDFDYNTKNDVEWTDVPTWNGLFDIPEPRYDKEVAQE